MKSNYFVSSFIWSLISKIINAAIQFITVPLLLNYFGINQYGILTLAIATNAYMQLLDLGINIGAIKFYSQWKIDKNYELIDRVGRTSLSFYGIIGIVNSLILILIAYFGENLFVLTHVQFQQFQIILLLLSAFSIINWATTVFTQLLTADEQIGFVQKVTILKVFLNVIAVAFTLWLKLSLVGYFFIFLVGNSVIIFPYYFRCVKSGLLSTFMPLFFWKDFKLVFKYSISIFLMSLFQYTASQSRPIILGIFSNKGVSILSEYRIIEVFPIFIYSIGGLLTMILLPKASKFVYQNNVGKIQQLAYDGTTYSSILVSVLCFPIILCSKEIITLYVGVQYNYLSQWLSLWCFIIIIFLHNTPIASLVLATGKTRMLIVSSSISCIISIIINALLCEKFGVGSAIIGFGIYIIIQMSFYYFYFNSKVLNLSSLSVFKSFIKPIVLASILFIVINLIKINYQNMILISVLKVIIWLGLYLCGLFLLKILKFKSIANLLIN